MKRILLLVVFWIALPFNVFAQNDFAERFIRSYEAGVRSRQLQEQTRLIEQQREWMKQQIRKTELEMEQLVPK